MTIDQWPYLYNVYSKILLYIKWVYANPLLYCLITEQVFSISDQVLIVTTGFTFYLFGYIQLYMSIFEYHFCDQRNNIVEMKTMNELIWKLSIKTDSLSISFLT